MSIWIAVPLVLAGTALVIFFSGRLVRGVVGTSRAFGVSTFLVSVLFVGFDPENLAVGATGSYEDIAGIALGSIVGAAMVAFALAFGITALAAPMRFKEVPKEVLGLPVVSVLLFGALAIDGTLTRADGGWLLGGYALAVVYLVWLSRRGKGVRAATKPREVVGDSRWKAAGVMLVSLVAIAAGSEMLIAGSRTLIDRLGITDTFFGMTLLAFLVSVEEVARELPAAMEGRPEISFGNVVGSALAFFLFNAGVIALVRPVEVAAPTRRFYLPVALLTVVLVSLFVWRRTVPRWAGALLTVVYAAFVVGGYVMGGGGATFPAP